MVVVKSADADAFVARPDPTKSVVLVYGPDAGLVSERVEALVRASVDDPADALAVTKLAGDELASDPARLIDEAQAIPMFGGRRAIHVRAGARSFVAAIEGLIGASVGECRVIVEAGELRPSAPLRSLCEKARNVAVIPCYADTARDLARLIDDEMRRAELTLDGDARAALVPLLGGDRRASRNELRKLALYAHGRDRVTIEDVHAVVGDAAAQEVDALIDAAFAGRTPEFETRFARAQQAGTAPGTMAFAAIRQAATLHKARLRIDAGGSADGEAEALRMHFSRKDGVAAALRTWTSAQLERALAVLADAQLETRRSPALGYTFIHRALMSLSEQARRRSKTKTEG